MCAVNVTILTEGGAKIGFGHLTRCISLYQAFKEKVINSKIIVNGDRQVLDFLKGKNYQICNWIKEKNKISKIIKDSNVVIIDSYLANKFFYETVSDEIKNNLLVMIDDYKRIEYPCGIVINPSIYGDKINYSKKNNTIFLTGRKYIILRKEFWNIPTKKIKKEIKKILITLSGINHKNLIYEIIKTIKKKYNFEFKIVKPRKRIISPKKMLNLMLDNDICISGGGQTLNELARIGLPTIAICLAENQKLNLQAWYKVGFVEYIKSCSNHNLLNELMIRLKKLLPCNEREKRNKIARDCVDGNGTRRITAEILKIFKMKKDRILLRSVIKDDRRDLWKWRNHPKIRKNSFNESYISWENHKSWFNKKINDKNTIIYIALKNNFKIGVIRFEIEKDLIRISINLNPKFLGKGFGTEIIKQGTEEIFKKIKSLKPIIAEIKKDNIVSQMAFAKAGYRYKKEKNEKIIYEKK